MQISNCCIPHAPKYKPQNVCVFFIGNMPVFKLSQQGYATPATEVNNTQIYNGRLSRIWCIFTTLLSHVSGSNKLSLPIVSRKNIFVHHPFENMFLLRRLDDNILTSKYIYMCLLSKSFYEKQSSKCVGLYSFDNRACLFLMIMIHWKKQGSFWNHDNIFFQCKYTVFLTLLLLVSLDVVKL